MFDLPAWAETSRAELDAWMQPLFADAWPPAFAEPCRYPLFGGGKRVRPLLTFAAFEAVAPVVDRSAACPAAAAVELIHTYSLVHDDMPCMDDDDERRGRPTVHVRWDEATAVLVGDALQTEAFAVLARAPLPAEVRIELVADLSEAAGYQGMVGGQAADIGLDVTEIHTLTRLHAGKTGALIRAAVVMGGRVGGATPTQLEHLGHYGDRVGLAFQLADDVLDLDEDDKEGGPPAFPKLLGADETLRRARALAQEAIEIAALLPEPQALVALARFTVERDV